VKILVLGGTTEGRHLAERLHELRIPAVSSLAGRVSNPRRPPGEVRTGGFGGADGLAAYLTGQSISAVVDATHPFAARITANAAVACRRTGVPLVVLNRPAWVPGAGDTWHPVSDLAGAAEAVTTLTGPDGHVLLTTGRQETAPFAAAPQYFWLRAVEPPDGPLPARCQVLLARGPFRLDDEVALMRDLAIDVLVTKNSGGPTAAKLRAARDRGIPVVIVERPPLPPGVTTAPDVPAALAHLRATLN
jgi:precorrin-6A/cobalt-precorrin-6A reductase